MMLDVLFRFRVRSEGRADEPCNCQGFHHEDELPWLNEAK